MFSIRGKLDNGHTVSGTVPAKDAGAAVSALIANLPAGRTLSGVTVKAVDGGALRISKPRTKKEESAPSGKKK